MKYTEEMILRSSSGYCMPFEERGKNVEVTLGYGQQKHPVTEKLSFITVWTSVPTTTCWLLWHQER